MTIFTKSSLILVRRFLFTYISALFLLSACGVGNKDKVNSCVWEMQPVFGVCDTVDIDTMDIKNPFIAYNHKADMYYMTGDGGYVWKSKDLHVWAGPYNVLAHDTTSWLGTSPVIKSPEIRKFANKYYYMATFETTEHCSCEILVADRRDWVYCDISSVSSTTATAAAGSVTVFPSILQDFSAKQSKLSNVISVSGRASIYRMAASAISMPSSVSVRGAHMSVLARWR